MAGLGDIVQKAFYLGVGLATAAGEQAGEKLSSIGIQAQKLTDEMVSKGEITTEEARKLVDEMIKSAQQQNLNQAQNPPTDRPQKTTEPRRIDIIADNEPSDAPENINQMRQQVEALQEELKRMKNS
jgi:polyhydroxyalkanoate synthesis regulator phasin